MTLQLQITCNSFSLLCNSPVEIARAAACPGIGEDPTMREQHKPPSAHPS